MVSATLSALATGAVNLATERHAAPVVLKPGDAAPDFSLPGSDGRTYRLGDLAGSTVILAWFPKAFTGG
jgi:peroxiredoxin Q/BCP